MEPSTTLGVCLSVDRDRVDLLVAELAELGYEAFEEGDGQITAFIGAGRVDESLRRSTAKAAAALGAAIVDETEWAPENWNEQWESTVRPILAGRFCVHPPWSEPDAEAVAIRIEPKMSFGTGHHETTRLMLRLLDRHLSAGDRVLDVGTGTGVLAIAAVRIGAVQADAFDIDPWSVENARENARANGVADRLSILAGGVEVAPAGPYDVILANINRNVLIEMMPAFAGRLRRGGRLLVAGFLESDHAVMTDALQRHGLAPIAQAVEGDWMAVVAQGR